MQFLTPPLDRTYHPSVEDYRQLERRIEELQKQLDEQSKEIFNLKWELSGLKFSLIQDVDPGREHALLNDVVLRRLAFFLSKGDLLNSRLVCRKWNNAILPRLRREFYFHFKQHYGWLLIYVIIYFVLLMPRMLFGSASNRPSTQ